MLQYVNRYYGASNNDRNEVILSFFQECPSSSPTQLKEPGIKKVALEDISTVEVASLVMSKESAQRLLNMLQGLLQHEVTDNPES